LRRVSIRRSASRPAARGKFLFDGERKLYVRGVTYGTFAPARWDGFPEPDVVGADFAAMAAAGVDTVRVYAPPPVELLDLAAEHGLRVLVGIAWEQHVTFLDERRRARSIEDRVRAAVAEMAGHPALLAYAVGNEIPAPIVRWHGRGRIERFLERLYRAAKDEDPGGLVTYVNYPSTEYLQLPFLDLVCFNVFLEDEERLDAYVARLQNIAGERPLLLTELGLDSRTHGEQAQAAALTWQIGTAFRGGCAGAIVFSWTDEWHRGGHDVDDWSFGLVDRRRRPKQALAAVRNAFADVPVRSEEPQPRVSVVVCSHNGGATIAHCLAGIAELDYPDYETIVVDDGSTDGTAEIAARFAVRLIRTENSGLAAARNTGLAAATGDIVAYVDDDARPDPHWLRYVAAALMTSGYAAVGGPNIAPRGDGLVAEAVARSPGGPVHVLLSDREAEHIPGCNMAFWTERLREIGGFDPQFRVAGDDVDICWQIHERGWRIGFHAGAVVWHRRRGSVRAFWRQQRGYGRAEALLERKWPDKYNGAGHLTWSGRVYTGAPLRAGRRWRVYYGTWGTGLFQSIYERSAVTLAALALLPEWYALIALLGVAAGYDVVAEPLLFAVPGLDVPVTLPLFLAAVLLLVVQAARSASRAASTPKLRVVTTLLTATQPLARLLGRARAGLTPWRLRGAGRLALPRPRTLSVWSETWDGVPQRLGRVEARLRPRGTAVSRGGDFDRWDIHVRAGMLGSARIRLGIEDHDRGRQLLRFRVWPRVSAAAAVSAATIATVLAVALARGSPVVAALAGAALLGLGMRTARECAAAVGVCVEVVSGEDAQPDAEHLRAALDRRLAEVKRAETGVRALTAGETERA
jgi:O-antigen biosynthesis protein